MTNEVEMIDGLPVIDVNKRYRTASGERFDYYAWPDVVAEGLMVNQPVLLRTPRGKLVHGNRILFTAKGIEKFKREAPLNIRIPRGGVQ